MDAQQQRYSEPPPKKQKIENVISKNIDSYIDRITKSCINLYAVVNEELFQPMPSIKVQAGHVKDQKVLSKAISVLNEKIPLKNLSHLKRVRKMKIILCPSDYLNHTSSIQEYIELNVPELKDIFAYFQEMEVPAKAPKLRRHLTGLSWPCNFHPCLRLEQLVSDSFFTFTEMDWHKTFMKIAFEVSRWHLRDEESNPGLFLSTNSTVIVDFEQKTVVAAAFCNNDHPIQHSVMVAIDNVAKTQHGGVWNVPKSTSIACISGFNPELLQHLYATFPYYKFCAPPYIEKKEDEANEGPYLCTNYYVYTLREPCIMCSMALVHARAKRLFYCFDNVNGGVKSKTQLHLLPSLNHHFEVFTGFLRIPCTNGDVTS